MLLTGARPGEVLSLRWEDVDTQWKGLTIRDKVEGLRVIPATPYVLHLLAALPRRNEWVFASARVISLDAKHIKRRARYHAARGTVAPVGDAAQTSESGRIVDPSIAHHRACIAAGLGGLTLHGLRRSFASLTEWLEVPAGVVAQIMGHKPSAIAEKHYIVRPLELLRVHHERIEAWILEQAGIQFDAKAAPARCEWWLPPPRLRFAPARPQGRTPRPPTWPAGAPSLGAHRGMHDKGRVAIPAGAVAGAFVGQPPGQASEAVASHHQAGQCHPSPGTN